MNTIQVRLPAKHSLDWYDRCGEDLGVKVVRANQRYAYFEMSEKALQDLKADVEHYIECMGPADTGDIDYRPAARSVLNALVKEGLVR